MTQRVIDNPQLQAFMRLFEKWNQRINLSAARTRAELEQHVRDCLHVVPHLEGAKTVLDVGSGGGLPVVVAAISLPEVSFTALEPVHKKHAFLRTAARELALVNLEAFALRIEDHDRRDYDAACSRATANIAKESLPWLARVNGKRSTSKSRRRAAGQPKAEFSDASDGCFSLQRMNR